MISGSNNLTHSTWRHIWLLDPLKTLFNSCTLPYRTHPCQIEHQWADNINRKNSTPGHSLFVYTCEKCKQKVLQLITKVPKNKVGKKKIMILSWLIDSITIKIGEKFLHHMGKGCIVCTQKKYAILKIFLTNLKQKELFMTAGKVCYWQPPPIFGLEIVTCPSFFPFIRKSQKNQSQTLNPKLALF